DGKYSPACSSIPGRSRSASASSRSKRRATARYDAVVALRGCAVAVAGVSDWRAGVLALVRQGPTETAGTAAAREVHEGVYVAHPGWTHHRAQRRNDPLRDYQC